MQNKLHKKMLTSSDLKKFFNEDLSFEQDGKRIYLVPLKEFMKSEEFSKLPSVTYIDKDNNRKTECHFLNSITLTDVRPNIIVGKTKSEKTVHYVGLAGREVGGCFPNVQYELYVRLNADGTLNRDFVCSVRKSRKNVLGKFIDMEFYAKGVEHYFPTNEPCYYHVPSFQFRKGFRPNDGI